jgi:hypothetical protein
VFFVGDRPRSGRWRGDVDKEGGSPEEPLDELSVGGRHTSVRINWDGEPEVPRMKENGWKGFCLGTGLSEILHERSGKLVQVCSKL